MKRTKPRQKAKLKQDKTPLFLWDITVVALIQAVAWILQTREEGEARALGVTNVMPIHDCHI
jgi:hypothetical protein